MAGGAAVVSLDHYRFWRLVEHFEVVDCGDDDRMTFATLENLTTGKYAVFISRAWVEAMLDSVRRAEEAV